LTPGSTLLSRSNTSVEIAGGLRRLLCNTGVRNALLYADDGASR